MTNTPYSVRCLLCSTEVGQLLNGRLRRHPGCTGPLPRRGGAPRCCHCGGSLYLEPISRTELALLTQEVMHERTSQAEQRRRSHAS